MNITKENIDALNAVLKVKVSETDYAEKVENAIRNYQRRASMPGFRPGKVPASLVKKMHGKSILVDEINKLLGDTLHNYITENKIDVLGNPLPKINSGDNIDWDTQKEFEFEYEMGLAPQFELNLSASDKVTFYTIQVTEKEIENAMDEMRRRYGKVEYPDTVAEKDMLFVELHELENGAPKEGGFRKSGTVMVETIKNADLKSKLIGKKQDETFTIVPATVTEALEKVLGDAKDNTEQLAKEHQLKIFSISRMEPAEINQELYDKVYGFGNVNGIEEFRAKIKEELEQAYKNESGQHFKHEVNHLVTDKFNLSLPDAFLKRWIKAVNDKPITDEQIEKEYPGYANNLKLQLIENKIVKDNNISVSREEAEEYTQKLIEDNFKRYGREIEENEIKATIKRVLENEEEAKRIFQRLYDEKLSTFYQTKLGIEYKSVTAEEFNKLLEEHYSKHHTHSH